MLQNPTDVPNRSHNPHLSIRVLRLLNNIAGKTSELTLEQFGDPQIGHILDEIR